MDRTAHKKTILEGFFEESLHFGRRGREGWRSLKKSSFVFKKDDTDKRGEYVTITYNEVTEETWCGN